MTRSGKYIASINSSTHSIADLLANENHWPAWARLGGLVISLSALVFALKTAQHCNHIEGELERLQTVEDNHETQPLSPAQFRCELRHLEAQQSAAETFHAVNHISELINTFMDRYKLSVTERHIAAHIISGKTYKEIARLMYLSERSVKYQVYVLFDKVCVSGRREFEQLIHREISKASVMRNRQAQAVTLSSSENPCASENSRAL